MRCWDIDFTDKTINSADLKDFGVLAVEGENMSIVWALKGSLACEGLGGEKYILR